jgi:hypothetical protein
MFQYLSDTIHPEDRPVLFFSKNDIEKRKRVSVLSYIYFSVGSFFYPIPLQPFISYERKESMKVERKSAILLLCEHASSPILILSA